MTIDLDSFLDDWEAEQAQPQPEPEPEPKPADDGKKYRPYVAPKLPLTTEQAMAKEVEKLTAALAAPELPREEELTIRERLAFLTARRSDLAFSMPYAGTEDWELQARLEASEEERDALKAELDAALGAPGGKPSARARRLQAEYDSYLQGRANLTAELQGRMIREATAIGMAAQAGKKAVAELKASDQRTITDAPSAWRRAKLTEELAESLAERIAARAKQIEADLWRNAEVAVGRNLLGTSTAHASATDVAREREAQATIDRMHEKYAPTS